MAGNSGDDPSFFDNFDSEFYQSKRRMKDSPWQGMVEVRRNTKY